MLGCSQTNNNTSIHIAFPSEYYQETLDGRMIVLISKNNETEPRFQLRDDAKTCQGFGLDVENWQNDQDFLFDTKTASNYPLPNLSDLPSGEFYLQVLFHKYETFTRADGHIVKLPMDRGEGQQWNRAPGNLYSTPQKITIKDGKMSATQLKLDQKIPPIKEPEDSKYIKHIKIKSKLLSEFWGRDMYLGAHVLLPKVGIRIQM